MLDKPRILSLFPNSFNKFNNMSTHVRSSIYTMMKKYRKRAKIPYKTNIIVVFITYPATEKIE